MLNKIRLIFLLLTSDYYIVPKKQMDIWIYELDNLRRRTDTVKNNNVYHVLLGRIESMSSITRKILNFNNKH
jgi:hypothetical protein